MKTSLPGIQKLALALAVSVIVLVGCARSPEAIKNKHLAQGKRLLQKHDFNRAILEFKNAVQVAPNDAESYYQLGLALSDSGDVQSAVYAYQRATELNPKHAGAQVRLSQIMAAAGDEAILKEAEQRLGSVIANGEGSPETTNILAFTLLRLGQTDEAIKNLEAMVAKSPTEFRASSLLAAAKIRQKDLKGAEEVLVKARESAPQSVAPRIMLGRFYLSQRRISEAEAQFQQALAMVPGSAVPYLDLGILQNSTGRKQEAEQTFQRLSRLKDKNVHPEYGLFLFGQGRREDAVREFERLVKEHPDDHDARTRLVAAYNEVKNPAKAQAVLEAALKKNGKDTEALIQRAEIQMSAGKFGAAETDLNQVLRMRPNSAEVHYILAKLHEKHGEPLTYRQELGEALRLNPNLLAVRLELARSLTASKNAKSALDLLNETPASARSNPAMLVERNWALWSSGDLKEMRRGIDAALAQGGTPDLFVQDGLWKLKAGDFNGARTAVEKALQLDPSDLRALATLADVYGSERQSKTAVAKVEEYAAKQPGSAPVQEFMGLLFWANGDRAKARVAFDRAKAASPQSISADLRLTQMDVLDQKWDDANHRLKSVLADHDDNTLARLWLANLEEYKGKHESALENLRKVVQVEPANALALNNLAFLLSERAGKPDEALQYAEKAQEIAPDNPEYADTLGWILYRKGLYTLSLKHLERAAAQRGSNVWHYHLAMAYAKSGDVNRGRTTLEAALKRNPNLPEAKMAQEVLHSH